MRLGKHKRQLAPWLLGLLVAVLLTALVLLLFNLYGYGDDPVIEGLNLITR